MTTEFIGSIVLLTLRSPPSARVRGVVANIVEQKLTLQDVFWLESKHSSSSFTVDGANIADLEILPDDNHTLQNNHDIAEAKPSEPIAISGITPLPGSQVPPSTLKSVSLPLREPQQFADPAIVSLRRPPTKRESESQAELPQTEPPSVPSPLVEEAALGNPPLSLSTLSSKPAVPTTTKPKAISTSAHISAPEPSSTLASATLSEPFNGLALEAGPKDTRLGSVELGNTALDSHIPEELVGGNGSVKRRPRRKTKVANASIQGELPSEKKRGPEQSLLVKGQRRTSATDLNFEAMSPSHRGKEAVQHKSNTSSKKQTRHEKTLASEAQNGWATEDATDIQEMGDFDFEANLSKFDKRSIFDQLRRDDTTADEARLVHHNRLPPKPGTSGGKNLHWTENVLESPTPKLNGFVKWNSEAGDSESSLSDDARISSGRSTKRSVSRSTVRRPASRKGSGVGTNEAFRTSTTPLSSLRHSSFDNFSNVPPKSYTISTPTKTRPSLRISTSNKMCPCLSPLQILEFEQYGISDLGMTEDMITENAARGIAETVTRLLRDTETGIAKSSIVILAGNHKSGGRAIAAARQLRNHGVRVNACILGSEREENLLDSIKQQSSAYRKAGGKLYTPSVLSDALKGGQVQPTLIIDALLGIHTCFDDLRRDDQATYFDIALWVNRNNLEVMSLDVPSGIDVLTGEVTLVNSKPLAFFPTTVLSLGLPKPWLLATADSTSANKTQLFLADIGISNVAWQRLGKTRNRGVDWGGEWVVELKYSGTKAQDSGP